MTAIEFENISKQYRLGLVSTRTLSHDIDRWWKVNVLRREDPYLKIGEVNDRSTKGNSDYVWALKDINFKVEQGDVVGIIGKNGAGKSTLLKLLSRVTAPTTGTIKARGRIASLLEVGTGFHNEMTGRENIYLNGAILGMTKQEITRKLDEIVDFSGCERYLDTPVKRYSSGMMVRLGFAVAAHLDPEILVVDEVLAVGDAEFQKKAIGKMNDISKGEGRTVLFVSHNMASIRALCHTGIVLEKGMIEYNGNIEDAVDFYLNSGTQHVSDIGLIVEDEIQKYRIKGDGSIHPIEILKIQRLSPYLEDSDSQQTFRLTLRNNERKKKFQISALVDEVSSGNRVGLVCSPEMDLEKQPTIFDVDVVLKGLNLTKGRYRMNFWIGIGDVFTSMHYYDRVFDANTFEVETLHGNFINMWDRTFGFNYFDGCEFHLI